ncbi:MAG: sporulation transcriptional regulator SpoIIID [Clostridia bacterium]
MIDIEERAKILATYIIETKSTVRATARKFNISKSTVHKDIAQRLEKVNPSLAIEAKKVLQINKSQRHIRGGLATKMKYEHEHEREYEREHEKIC